MTPRKKGTGYDPTKEELEFIYARIPQLSDGEILEEMKDVSFPVRKSGFIKRRRKELDAAKTVLREQVKKEIAPIIIESKKEHYGLLANIAVILLDKDLKTVAMHINDESTKLEYVLFENGELDSPSKPLDKQGLANRLQSNIETVHSVHTGNRFHQEFLPHLMAEIPDIDTNGLDSYINEHPHELIITLITLIDRKIFEGKCPVCEEW